MYRRSELCFSVASNYSSCGVDRSNCRHRNGLIDVGVVLRSRMRCAIFIVIF